MEILVPRKIYEERINICKKCSKFNKRNQCTICNCAMTLKCHLPNASCPDNPSRW
mgnify:FL=1|jgi:hypothetical protein